MLSARRRRGKDPYSDPAPDAAKPEPPAPSTHNLPQPGLLLTAEEWAAWLEHIFDGALKRRAEFEAPFKRFVDGYPLRANPVPGEPPIGIEQWDDSIAARAIDMRGKLVDLTKLAARLHEAEKAPVLIASRAIDGFLKSFMAPLETTDTKGKLVRGAPTMRNVLTDRLTLWELEKADRVRRENARIAAEEQARAEALAQQAIAESDADKLQQAADAAVVAQAAAEQAAAPDRELGRSFGTLGGSASLRDNWIWEPGDLMELVKAVAAGKEKLEYLTFNGARLTYAVKSEKVRAVAGVVIKNDQQAG